MQSKLSIWKSLIGSGFLSRFFRSTTLRKRDHFWPMITSWSILYSFFSFPFHFRCVWAIFGFITGHQKYRIRMNASWLHYTCNEHIFINHFDLNHLHFDWNQSWIQVVSYKISERKISYKSTDISWNSFIEMRIRQNGSIGFRYQLKWFEEQQKENLIIHK